ncbi:MAG: amidohydrolase family protein [Verrucomicrobia bacterium]|nr:amidohydrolase family protein [Verrucomicrobiota bacterium]
MTTPLSRRQFLAVSAMAALASPAAARAADGPLPPAGPIIDIHQHTNYHGRTDQQMLAHQRAMGVTQTILLPSGRRVQRESTHNGKSDGLAAGTGGNDTVIRLAKEHPGEIFFGANEVTDLPEARGEIEKYLKLGAIIIAEQKFNVDCDSKESEILYALAGEYRVPILLHFQHATYNKGFERFHKVLEKFPKVNFIGHAQTWWANIDAGHADQKVLYPKGSKVTPGGITDRLLRDYPNMFADMSAGSGLNALLRDEEHTRGFLERHQDKILYGSDCTDTIGRGPGCQGAQTIAAIRRLAPSRAVERKILYENSKKLFRL